jgi:hypothetical protein
MFSDAQLKSVKANLATGEITITLSVSTSPDNMQEATLLAERYVGSDSTTMELTIVPKQIALFEK